MDVVFSNAVFHWIDEQRQQAMLQCVYSALKQHGQFVFEFGGSQNNRLIHETLAGVLRSINIRTTIRFTFPPSANMLPVWKARDFG